MITALRVVAILFAGLMTGLLFGDWLGPSFARKEMPLSGFVQFQQIIHYNYLKVLPAVSVVALLAPIGWLVLARRNGVEFRILLFATIAIAVGFAITFIYNVPVNDILESWDYKSPPSNARDLWQPWESAHVVRTIFWASGFLLEIVALAVTARSAGVRS
jgi:uncharacterized membrane protein